MDAIRGEKRPATVRIYQLYLERLPDKPLNQLAVQALYEALPAGKGAANLCFATFKAFFSWCVERDYIDFNPLLKRRQPNRLQSRDRLLTDGEVRTIWEESFNHGAFGQLVRCLILSGQRLNQFQSFQPAWVQADAIVFPAAIMKSRLSMTLPLTPMLRATLT